MLKYFNNQDPFSMERDKVADKAEKKRSFYSHFDRKDQKYLDYVYRYAFSGHEYGEKNPYQFFIIIFLFFWRVFLVFLSLLRNLLFFFYKKLNTRSSKSVNKKDQLKKEQKIGDQWYKWREFEQATDVFKNRIVSVLYTNNDAQATNAKDLYEMVIKTLIKLLSFLIKNIKWILTEYILVLPNYLIKNIVKYYKRINKVYLYIYGIIKNIHSIGKKYIFFLSIFSIIYFLLLSYIMNIYNLFVFEKIFTPFYYLIEYTNINMKLSNLLNYDIKINIQNFYDLSFTLNMQVKEILDIIYLYLMKFYFYCKNNLYIEYFSITHKIKKIEIILYIIEDYVMFYYNWIKDLTINFINQSLIDFYNYLGRKKVSYFQNVQEYINYDLQHYTYSISIFWWYDLLTFWIFNVLENSIIILYERIYKENLIPFIIDIMNSDNVLSFKNFIFSLIYYKPMFYIFLIRDWFIIYYNIVVISFWEENNFFFIMLKDLWIYFVTNYMRYAQYPYYYIAVDYVWAFAESILYIIEQFKHIAINIIYNFYNFEYILYLKKYFSDIKIN